MLWIEGLIWPGAGGPFSECQKHLLDPGMRSLLVLLAPLLCVAIFCRESSPSLVPMQSLRFAPLKLKSLLPLQGAPAIVIDDFVPGYKVLPSIAIFSFPTLRSELNRHALLLRASGPTAQ